MWYIFPLYLRDMHSVPAFGIVRTAYLGVREERDL